MQRTSLYFTGPRQLSLRQEPVPELQPDRVLVQSLISAISPGTETLLYRGQFPEDMPLDASIDSLAGEFSYPLKYGYAIAGQVIDTGREISADWQGRLVFAFNPHESHFTARPEDLMPLPQGITPEQAVFLPNMETAVNFVMDGAPLIGEKVAVFGQGIVGLLTTALLARFPLSTLLALDHYPLRQQASIRAGAHACLEPGSPQTEGWIAEHLPDGADLALELSGAPPALDQAIAVTGYGGRVVIGSWYGKKKVNLDLGGRFHRSRMRLISSQVSSIAPEWTARWTKERRFETAWSMIREVEPESYITQRFPIERAEEAYALLDQRPEDAIQVLLTY